MIPSPTRLTRRFPIRWISGAVLPALLVGYFVAAMAWQFHTGLADNGDFTRGIKIFSPGPVGIRPNFPPPHSGLWYQRFYRFWLPRWTLRRQSEKPITSALVFWVPGIAVSELLAPGAEISLPLMSIVPRLLLLGELILLLLWARQQSAGKVLAVTVGLPAVLLLTTTDQAAYLNSFYQEQASLVFVLPLFFSLVYLRRRPTPLRLAVVILCLALLATGKESLVYWPALALPFILYCWVSRAPARWRDHARRTVAIGCTAACALTLVAHACVQFHEDRVNPYHSLFYGALTFSQRPAEHLQRLGFADGRDCINVSAYQEPGTSYFEAHRDRMTFLNTVTTVAHEPAILWRMGRHVLAQMQDLSLGYLGKYAANDPRSLLFPPSPDTQTGAEQRMWNGSQESTLLNTWATLKYHCFPTGGKLALTLTVFAAWFGWQLRGTAAAGELALAGLLASVATVADMAIAILGDGRYELIKHLYFANLLFDIAAIAFVNSVGLWLWESWSARRRVISGVPSSGLGGARSVVPGFPMARRSVPRPNCSAGNPRRQHRALFPAVHGFQEHVVRELQAARQFPGNVQEQQREKLAISTMQIVEQLFREYDYFAIHHRHRRN
jgi:hypothetical protein